MADCSLLSADIGQKNLLAVFEPLIIEHLNQPSRIVPHLQSIIPLSMHLRFDEIFNNYFIASLSQNVSVKTSGN